MPTVPASSGFSLETSGIKSWALARAMPKKVPRRHSISLGNRSRLPEAKRSAYRFRRRAVGGQSRRGVRRSADQQPLESPVEAAGAEAAGRLIAERLPDGIEDVAPTAPRRSPIAHPREINESQIDS
jgi:hypothetical protein